MGSTEMLRTIIVPVSELFFTLRNSHSSQTYWTDAWFELWMEGKKKYT